MRQWFRGALFGFCFVDPSSFCLIAGMWSVDVARKWIRDDDLVMGRWSFKLPVQCSFFLLLCAVRKSPQMVSVRVFFCCWCGGGYSVC